MNKDMTTPDNWVIIKVIKDDETFYKILAGWSGSYLHGDSWRMNSGVAKVEDNGDSYLFHGYSGSIYKCNKESYGLRMNNAHIWSELKGTYPDNVELMENMNWLDMKWDE
jgi:hypothetical protein